jgi:hypothetical protein
MAMVSIEIAFLVQNALASKCDTSSEVPLFRWQVVFLHQRQSNLDRDCRREGFGTEAPKQRKP